MNKVCISGRLTQDPIYKSYSEQTQLTTFFIANNRYYGENQKTGFFKVKAWGNFAKIIAEHCKTGTKLFITGELEQSRYENEHGDTIYDVSINMVHFDFAERRSAGKNDSADSGVAESEIAES